MFFDFNPENNRPPAEFCFSRNPILFSLRKSHEFRPGETGFAVTIDNCGDAIFKGTVCTPFEMNVAEIIDSYIDYLPDPEAVKTGDDIIIELEDSGTLSDRMFTIESGGSDRDLQFVALKGGASKSAVRTFATGHDIFTDRLLARPGNIFFTTRTSGSTIYIKETELYPFVCLLAKGDVIVIRDAGGRSSVPANAISTSGAYAIDFNAARRYIFDRYNVLSNVFDVIISGVGCCRVVIESAEVWEKRMRLKFRNSFGVFELLEVKGDASLSHSINRAEPARRYNRVLDDYTLEPERATLSDTIEVTTGPLLPYRRPFVLDAMASEEVYLLDYESEPLRVIVSAQEARSSLRPTNPEAFSLTLTPVDEDVAASTATATPNSK